MTDKRRIERQTSGGFRFLGDSFSGHRSDQAAQAEAVADGHGNRVCFSVAVDQDAAMPIGLAQAAKPSATLS